MQVAINFLCKISSASSGEVLDSIFFEVKQTKNKGFLLKFWQIL